MVKCPVGIGTRMGGRVLWMLGLYMALILQTTIRNCQTSQTQHQQDNKVMDYAKTLWLLTELVHVADGNSDDNDVEDLQSTRDDSIDRLLGLDNMNEEGKSGKCDAWAKMYQDIVRDTISNEENTNILIHDIEGGTRKGSRK